MSLLRRLLRYAERHLPPGSTTPIDWSKLISVQQERRTGVKPPTANLEMLTKIVSAIISALPCDGDWRALVFTLAETGMRINEALGLRAGAVDLARDQISITVQKARKRDFDSEPDAPVTPLRVEVLNDGTRLVPPKSDERSPQLSPNARLILARQLERWHDGLVFRNPVGGSIDADLFRREEWAEAKQLAAERLAAAGQHDSAAIARAYRLHWLRAYAAQSWLYHGATPKFVGDQLGHTSSYVTDRYADFIGASRAPWRKADEPEKVVLDPALVLSPAPNDELENEDLSAAS